MNIKNIEKVKELLDKIEFLKELQGKISKESLSHTESRRDQTEQIIYALSNLNQELLHETVNKCRSTIISDIEAINKELETL